MLRSLQVIGEIIRKEFYQIRQDRRMLAVSIAAPIIQVFVLGYTATTDIRNSTLAVCDMDRTAESREVIRRFTTSGYFVEGFAATTPDQVDPLIERGRAGVALMIPEGFGRDLLARRTARLQLVLDGTDANTAGILMGYASQVVNSLGLDILAGYATAAPGGVPRIVPEPRVWFNPDLKSAHFMVPGVVALVLMIITMTLTSLAIVKEKEIGTLEQLMVTPIRPWELILGKLIPFILIGFLDMVIVLAIARFWFEVPLRGSLLLLFGLSGLFILTTLGLGLLISTIARSQQQAMMIAQFFFFMPFLFFSGFSFPIANMPKVIQYVTYVIPLRYFLDIVRGIFLKGTDLAQLWPQAAALAGFGIAILTTSVLRFRKKLG